MEFKCGDNTCIEKDRVCDGILDCVAGDDEADCSEYNKTFENESTSPEPTTPTMPITSTSTEPTTAATTTYPGPTGSTTTEHSKLFIIIIQFKNCKIINIPVNFSHFGTIANNNEQNHINTKYSLKTGKISTKYNPTSFDIFCYNNFDTETTFKILKIDSN